MHGIIYAADLGRNENAEAVGPPLERFEGVFVRAVIPQVEGQHPLPLPQPQGPQQVSQRTALVPIHLHMLGLFCLEILKVALVLHL